MDARTATLVAALRDEADLAAAGGDFAEAESVDRYAALLELDLL